METSNIVIALAFSFKWIHLYWFVLTPWEEINAIPQAIWWENWSCWRQDELSKLHDLHFIRKSFKFPSAAYSIINRGPENIGFWIYNVSLPFIKTMQFTVNDNRNKTIHNFFFSRSGTISALKIHCAWKYELNRITC